MGIKANRRNIAILLLCAIVGVCLLSGVFMMTHAGHIHDRCGRNGNCGTCERMLAAAQTFRQVGMLILLMFAVHCTKVKHHNTARAQQHPLSLPTLVSQKVQMNN